MRDKVQERVEELAGERDLDAVELGLVEESIEIGRQAMEEMVKGYGEGAAAQPSREELATSAESPEIPPGTCPALAHDQGDGEPGRRYGEGHYTHGKPGLNEAGEMHAKATSDLSVTDGTPADEAPA